VIKRIMDLGLVVLQFWDFVRRRWK